MAALLELHIENYKSLRDVQVTLHGLNVLVGPNGAGKSNLLDVIRFLGDAARDDLVPALTQRGGADRVVFRGGDGSTSPAKRPIRRRFTISVKAVVTKYATPTAPDEYRLTASFIGSANQAAGVSAPEAVSRYESFTFKRYGGAGRRLTLTGTKFYVADEDAPATQKTLLQKDSLALSTLPRLASEAGGAEVGRIASLFTTFRVFDIDVVKARQPTAVTQGGTLRPDASNLSAFLLRLSNHPSWESLLKDARAVVPGLEDVSFRTLGGASESVVVELHEKGLRGATPLADASYGTIRLLALLALLYDPDPPLLTCVEELDHGLHPWAFDRIAELLRAASSRTQFILATHSPAFVNRLNPHELIVCERDVETGASRIPAVDSATVARMVESTDSRLGPGELWFSGSLGGVPGADAT